MTSIDYHINVQRSTITIFVSTASTALVLIFRDSQNDADFQAMANLIRSAKSPNDWSEGELLAYNIKLVRQDAVTFFGAQHLPLPQIRQEILKVEEVWDMTGDDSQEFINLVDLAMMSNGEDSAVADFIVKLFQTLRYTGGHRVALTSKEIPLFICGEWKVAKADVCLMNCLQNDIMLLVHENKCFEHGRQTNDGAAAQLVAKVSGRSV